MGRRWSSYSGRSRQDAPDHGASRLQAVLAAEGFHAGRDWIGRLRREMAVLQTEAQIQGDDPFLPFLPVADNLPGQVF